MTFFTDLINKLKGKRWAKWLGYGAFSWVTFTLALYLTFPSDAVRDSVTQIARQQAGMNLRIESTGLSFPLGLSLHDTFWILREPNPEEQKGAIAVHIDKLTVRPNLFALVRGKTGLKFDARLWDGKLAGAFQVDDEGQTLKAKASGLDLGASMLGAIGLDVDGTIDTFEIDFEGPDVSTGTGTLVINGSDLLINGGEVAHFSLPKIALGELDGTIQIGEGRAEIETFALNGADLEAKMEGAVRLMAALPQSTLQTQLSFKPSDAWWDANEMLKAGASMALPAGSDGFHTVHLYGQLGKPRVRTR